MARSWGVVAGRTIGLLGRSKDVRILPLLLLCIACGDDTRPRPAGDPFVNSPLFEAKREPGPSDWLARFKEPHRTFEDYRDADPVRARQGDVLRFVPVGKFDAGGRALLAKTIGFSAIWFALPVDTTKDQALPRTGWQRLNDGEQQVRTPWFLDHLLPPFRKDDAVCVSGITMVDLYPEESWNFVFGQASLRGRVGVWSFARLSQGSATLSLRRCCKLVVHEIGHMFGLEHCIRYECDMNGSNHLRELDSQPLHLCPDCLRKLAWNRGFDVEARYRKLGAFYNRHGLEREAKWMARRLTELSAANQPS